MPYKKKGEKCLYSFKSICVGIMVSHIGIQLGSFATYGNLEVWFFTFATHIEFLSICCDVWHLLQTLTFKIILRKYVSLKSFLKPHIINV